MADHVIKQVRDAIIARLTGLPGTGPRVHSYRVNPLTDLPALVVRTPSDAAQEAWAYEPRVYERQIDIDVSIYAAAVDGLDNALDANRKDIDQAMGANVTITGAVLIPVYVGSEVSMTEGENPAAELKLRYRINVRHLAAVPDVILDNER